MARHLEANGMPTVILGAARDIVTHCGVARFAFTDFPLGNPCGRPFDRDMQTAIASAAVDLFETATEAATAVTMPYRWSSDESWRDGYFKIREDDLETLRQAGEERRAKRQHLRAIGQVRRT
ncbi:MAG: hypothetical protein F4X98_18725 [Gammaproteobacteria bacterium]|nr:hypothetical protein [Gammaproteobacteria bacterium]